ncbi:MAG: GNAT family N-acetyltransferase [Pyrinomonadaceae bacterium]
MAEKPNRTTIELNIRRAGRDEAIQLTSLALDAKRYWGYPESWINYWESDLTISPDFINDNPVYVAEANGELCGFYALMIHHGTAELEHMWVAPQHIGTGLGKELFLHAMEMAASMKVAELQISADPNAAGFYQRMGATKIGETESPVGGLERKLPRFRIDPSRKV